LIFLDQGPQRELVEVLVDLGPERRRVLIDELDWTRCEKPTAAAFRTFLRAGRPSPELMRTRS
jgi:hypothetical protein